MNEQQENFQKENQEITPLDWLWNKAKRYRSSEEFRKMLNFSARFRNLAPYNAMLVYKQKPGAQYVLGANVWENRYHRILKPNAQNLVVLNFKPCGFVFDLADTIPDPDYKGRKWSDSEILWNMADREKAFFTEDYKKECLQNLFRHLPKQGIQLDDKYNTGSTLDASIRLLDRRYPARFFYTKTKETTYPLPYLISVSKNSREAEFVSNLMHELGHFFLRHLPVPGNWNTNTRDEYKWVQRENLPHNVKEIEAESVAWLVCSRIGVDTSAEEYIAGYLEECDEVPEGVSIEAIYTASNEICRMLKESLVYQDCLLYKYDANFREHLKSKNSTITAEKDLSLMMAELDFLNRDFKK